MTPNETYEKLYAEYRPNANDNPDNDRYYRTHYAIYNALLTCFGSDVVNALGGFNGNALHRCMCECRTYADCLRTFEQVTPNPSSEPYRATFYPCEPDRTQAEIDRIATDMCKREFKARWPNERVNGKLWKEKVPPVWSIACLRAKEQVQQSWESWEAKRIAHELREDARRDVWMEDVHEMALYEDALRTIRNA